MVMIAMQSLLLHIALTNRASAPSGIPAPFAPPTSGADVDIPRPYNFWRWRTAAPYWHTLGYLLIALISLQLLFGTFKFYAPLLGGVALAIEAVLPVPQLVANQRRRGCKGFRASVLVNWLVGDAFKMVFFFAKGTAEVPWAFKLCGVFQAACDVLLGVQFYVFGNGEPGHEGRDIAHEMQKLGRWTADQLGWDN
jgi:solute carrier family 66, member 2